MGKYPVDRQTKYVLQRDHHRRQSIRHGRHTAQGRGMKSRCRLIESFYQKNPTSKAGFILDLYSLFKKVNRHRHLRQTDFRLILGMQIAEALPE